MASKTKQVKNRKNQDKKILSDFCAGSKTNNKKINFNLNYETGSQKKKMCQHNKFWNF